MNPVQTHETQQTTAPAQTQALEKRQELAPIAIGDRGIQLQSYDDLWRFASILFRSGFAPKEYKGPEACFIAIQMGMEVGLSPMASVQNIAVVNGRGTLWGDALMGVVRASRTLETFEACWEIDGKRIDRLPAVLPDALTAVFTVKRLGEKPVTSTFSVVDAKRAGLWEKDGTWKQYPQRMLMNRARAFALRDAFGDILKGLQDKDEMGDIVDLPADAVTVETTPNPGPLPVAAPRRTRSTPPLATLTAPPQVQPAPSAPSAPAFVTVKGTAETVQPAPAPVTTTEPPADQNQSAEPKKPVIVDASVTAPTPPAAPSKLAELRTLIQGEGFSFLAVKEAVTAMRWVDTSNWHSWESVEEGIAGRMLGAKTGLIRQLKANEAKKEAAATPAA